jgi:fructose transport system ATP-binding protein
MVLELIRNIRDRGATVIFISHNLPHVWEVADRMIVLRTGRRVGTLFAGDATMDQAVSLMTGALTDTRSATGAVDRLAPGPEA